MQDGFNKVNEKVINIVKYVEDLVDKKYFEELICDNTGQHLDKTHYLALKDGEVYGFGNNEFGQLGISPYEKKYCRFPVKIDVGCVVEKVYFWEYVSFFISKDGEMYWCGAHIPHAVRYACNDHLINYSPKRFFRRSSGKVKIGSIDIGRNFFAFLFEDSTNICFCTNLRKYKGPVVSFRDKIKSIACCTGGVICLTENGNVISLVSKDSSFSIYKRIDDKYKFIRKGIKSIFSGINHLFLLSNIGELYSYNLETIQKIELENKVLKVSCGYDHILVLCDNNEVYSFGCNDKGQLGFMKSDDDRYLNTPHQIVDICRKKVSSIYCLLNSSLIIYEDGDITHFGVNDVLLSLIGFNTSHLAKKTKGFGLDEQFLKNSHFEFKFDNGKGEYDKLLIAVQSSLCLQSPYLKKIIKANVFEKKFERRFYSCFELIKRWLEGNKNIQKNTDLNDVKNAVELSRKFELPHLTFHLCSLVGNSFVDKKEIVQLLIDLKKEKKEDSPLFLACERFIKDNHKDFIHVVIDLFNESGLLKDVEMLDLYKRMIGIVYENSASLEKHDFFKGRVVSDNYALGKCVEDHKSSLFNDKLTPNIIFESVDGKRISLHKEILVEYEYFRAMFDLGNGFIESNQKIVKFELKYEYLYFLMKFLYKKRVYETKYLDYVFLKILHEYFNKYMLTDLKEQMGLVLKSRERYLDYSKESFISIVNDHINLNAEFDHMKFVNGECIERLTKEKENKIRQYEELKEKYEELKRKSEK